FLRVACQPTRQQYEKIAADGEAALKATIRAFAVDARGLGGDTPDPRLRITNYLAMSVQGVLSPEQAARYREELNQRAAARRAAMILNLVAKIDKALLLSTQQRVQLRAVLQNHWHDSWNQTQFLTLTLQYVPNLPDAKILPVLTQTQKQVWRTLPRTDNVRFGFNLGVVQGIAMDEEVWDGERPGKKREEPDGQAGVPVKGPAKPVEKK